MYCTQCGSLIVEGSIFCSVCGRKQKEAETGESLASIKNNPNINSNNLDFEIIAYAQPTRFGYQKVTTTINIRDDTVEVIANFHGKILLKTKPQMLTFKIVDIATVSYGYGTITYFIDVLRYILALILIPFSGFGILVLIFFIYITICNTIKIMLKNGSTVVMYFDNKHHTTDLVNSLTSKSNV